MTDDKYDYYLKSGLVGSLAKSVNVLSDPINLWLKVQILSPSLFGTFILTQVIINITAEVSALGLGNLVMHRVPKTISENNKRARNLTGQVLLISFASVSLAMLLLIISRNYIQAFFGESHLSLWIFWLALLAPLSTIRDFHSRWLKANERMSEVFLMGGLIPNPIALLGFFIVWWFQYGIYGILSVIFLERVISLTPWLISENLLFNLNLSTLQKKDFSFSLQLMGSRLVSLMNTNADILMLGWLGTSSMTAIYKVGSSLASSMSFIHGLTGTLFKPRISRFLGEENYDELEGEFRVFQQINLLAVFMSLILIVPLGEFILGIFGSTYVSAYFVLLILLSGKIIHLSTGDIGKIITFSGRSELTLLNTIVVFLINLIGNYFLIQLINSEGAALTWSVALATGNLLALIEVRIILGKFFYPVDVFFGALIALLTIGFGIYRPEYKLLAPIVLIPAIAYFSKKLFPYIRKIISEMKLLYSR